MRPRALRCSAASVRTAASPSTSSASRTVRPDHRASNPVTAMRRTVSAAGPLMSPSSNRSSAGVVTAPPLPASERLDELLHRRRSAESRVAPVEPARQSGGIGTASEGIVPVDEDRRRAAHPEPGGLLARLDFALAYNGGQVRPI